MKGILAALAIAPLGALASLNCTLTAPLYLYCCPSYDSEAIQMYETGDMVMLGCAADDKTDGRWFWNYNGLYTPSTYETENCVLNGNEYENTDVLPDCSVDDFVLDMTKGKTSPLDECDPMCVSNNNHPADVYFGDVVDWPEEPLEVVESPMPEEPEEPEEPEPEEPEPEEPEPEEPEPEEPEPEEPEPEEPEPEEPEPEEPEPEEPEPEEPEPEEPEPEEPEPEEPEPEEPEPEEPEPEEPEPEEPEPEEPEPEEPEPEEPEEPMECPPRRARRHFARRH